jgi:hypothetical protein
VTTGLLRLLLLLLLLPASSAARVMYHVEKFTAAWRNLVLFYLAM